MNKLWFVVKERRSETLCTHAMSGCLCHYELYFDGEKWEMARQNALKYSTKEEAETAAFMLVVRDGKDTGEVSAKEYVWESEEL